MSKDSHLAFGRGTPAGKALYNVYNGKKNMDSTLDPDLLARLQKMRKEREEQEALKTKVKPVPKSKTHVPVPKPTGGRQKPTPEMIAEYRLQMIGRQKQLSTILQEQAMQQPLGAPIPSKPAVTDADKRKLQQVMEYGGVLPEPSKISASAAFLPEYRSSAVAARRNGDSNVDAKIQRLSREFDLTSQTLAAKKADLREAQRKKATSAITSEEANLTNEIAQLVDDLKTLDNLLCDLTSDD